MKKKTRRSGRWKKWASGTGLIVLILLIAVRESDEAVARLYYIGWPIYSDYVYPPGIEKISFQSLDGTPLNGWFIHGKSPLAAKRPALLYVHGNAGNLAAQYSQFSFLQDWGYDVFAFDYRGFGFSGGHPTRAGLWKDTQAAFQELTLLAPGRKYGVVGFSMGAAYAAQLAAHDPRVSAAAFMGSFTTFRDIGSYTLGNWGFPRWTTPLLAWLLVPNGLDPLDAAGGGDHPPALFVHGTADGNVPCEMGQEMDRFYHGPKELLILPGYGHGDYFKGPLAGSFHQAFDRLFWKGGKG
ncbi:MAG TPA: alpha/beta hydrolase [bacterium]|nr:alpha/beta hydrolase [bacterium]